MEIKNRVSNCYRFTADINRAEDAKAIELLKLYCDTVNRNKTVQPKKHVVLKGRKDSYHVPEPTQYDVYIYSK